MNLRALLLYLPVPLHNCLQLSGVSERILDNSVTHAYLVLLFSLRANTGEEDLPISHDPSALLSKLDDGALRVEEEERLCRR